ncbi:MAG: hypothetical protein P9L98_05155 [Candidatus Kaelpia imicola]|nr:hypothetical protein [Candidatus Kaelpia imicola]
MKTEKIVLFVLVFLSLLLLNISYAIEDLENSGMSILGVYPVQCQSYTVWNINTSIQSFSMLPIFNLEELSDDFKSNIDLSGVSFSNIEVESNFSPYCFDNIVELPDIEIEEIVVELPISVEVIDEGNKVFKLILGNKERSSISFMVKDDGFYDLEGEFKDTFLEFEWANERFKITVCDSEESLGISIKPLNSEVYPRIYYKKEFNLGVFDGEYSLGFVNHKPYLDIILKDSDQEILSVDLDQDELSLKLNMNLPMSFEDSISLSSDSFKIEDGNIDGNIEITLNEDEQKVVLRIGEGGYFEITQNGSMREIIDKFYTEIAVDLQKMVVQLAEDDDSLDPNMTVDDIREVLWEATGDDLEGMFEIVQDANEQRQGLVVPGEVRLYLDLSSNNSQKNAELTFPLIEDSLALKMGLEPDAIQINCLADISSISTASTAEVGYNSDGLVLFKLADLAALSLVKLGVSLDGNIESVAFRVKNIEGDINREGFEVRSVEDSLLGSSALDILLRGLEVQDSSTNWCFGYDFEDDLYLGFGIPLSEEVKIRGRINNQGLSFKTQISFMGGGNSNNRK